MKTSFRPAGRAGILSRKSEPRGLRGSFLFRVCALSFALLFAGAAMALAESPFVRQDSPNEWWENSDDFALPYQFTIAAEYSPILFSAVASVTESDGVDLSDLSIARSLPASPTAVGQYWDTSDTTGLQAGNGTWSTSSPVEWNNSGGTGTRAVWTQNNDAFFETSGTSAITVSGTVDVDSITFDGTGYTIGGTTLTLTGAADITANANATINAPLGGVISLTKLGTATLTLGGVSTFTGAQTYIDAGTLQLGISNALPTSKPLTVGYSGAANTATFDLNGFNQTISALSFLSTTITGSFVTLGSGTLMINGTVSYDVTSGNNLASVISGSGFVDLGGGTRTFDVNLDNNTAGDLQISSVIQNGGITKALSGVLALDAANTYSGITTFSGSSAGFILLGNSLALQNSTLNYVNGGSIDFGSLTSATFGGLEGSNNLALKNDSSSAVALTVGNNNQTTTYSGKLSSSGALTKIGTGALTLTGANTYTGGTQVNGGSLFANNATNSVGSGAVTVSNSGTILGGNGTISGAVSLGAATKLAPGATGNGSDAILKTGSLTLASTSIFSVDLNGMSAGTTYDQVSVTGTVNITGATLTLNSVSGLAVGNKVDILSNDSTDAIVGTFNGLPQGATFASGGDMFQISYTDNFGGSGTGNDISLTVIPVPEPSTWLAALLALGAIALPSLRRWLRPATVTRARAQ